MSIDARLHRLSPALSAKERALLVFRSLKDRTPEDPSWRSSMPAHQTAEFNRLISLMNACNMHLPLFITMVEQHTEQLYLRFYWWHSLVALGLQAWRIAQLLPANKRSQAEAAVADYFPEAELPWDPVDNPRAWMTVAERMEAGIRLMLPRLWQEVCAIDVVLSEVAKELDGEDPLRSVMRGVHETARTRLKDLHELLNATEALELPEPDEETLDLARTYFEKGLQLMESI